MQTERSKKSQYFFEVELEEDEVEALVHLDPELLKKLFSRCGKMFQKQISDIESSSLFLDNYKMVMESHSAIFGNSLSVDLCLHFAVLYSQFLLLHNRESEAKAILKETQGYTQIQGIDSMLMGICLNNLTYLYARQGKIYRALAVALKGISILQWHLEDLKDRRQRNQIVEDVVVFVNLLMVSQTVLKRILRVNNKTFFKSLFKIINRLGYSFSNKYLGSDSLFSRKFYLPQQSLLLPVYHEEEKEEQQKDRQLNEFQVRIAHQLQNIYTALKQLNLEPEVYYIKERAVQIQSHKSSEIIIDVPEQVVPEVQEFSIFYTEEVQLDGWEAEISFYRQQTNLMVTSMGYEYIGNIQMKIKQGDKIIVQKIPEEKLHKIIDCLNINDVFPYEYSMKNLTPDQFFKRIMKNFLTISPEGRLHIMPRAKPVIDPFERKFGGEKVIVFVNHIYFKKFRVAICPKQNSDTIYLDINFRHKGIYELFELTQIQNLAISKLRQKYGCKHKDYNGHLKFGKFKNINIFDVNNFKTKVFNIIDKFESFLFDDDANIMEELSATNHEQSNKYYKYVEEKQGKGLFVQLWYRQNANYIEVYAKNTFPTHTPEGLQHSKGNLILTPQQFLRDFGIGMRISRKWMAAFCKLIIQKYGLRIYDQSLDQMQQDRYQQNAIQEYPMTSKFFKRKFLEFQEYLLPLTIELISVGLQKPLGLKISAYEPIKCLHVGLFIYVNFDYWQKASEDQRQTQNDEIEDAKMSRRYEFEKQYFFTQWLQQQGFERIFSKLQITNRQLQIKGISGKFCRLEDLL